MFLLPPPLIHSIHGDPRPIVGLTILDHEIFVLRSSSHHIDVYSSRTFDRLRPLSLPLLPPPGLVPRAVDIASCPRSFSVFVADAANSTIFRIDRQGNLISFWKQDDVTGLSMTSRGTLLVGTGSRVREVDTGTGRVVRTISGKMVGSWGGRGKVEMRRPRHFLWRGTDQEDTGSVVVCDWKNESSPHTVYRVDPNGRISTTHGNEPGSGEGALNFPSHLAPAPMGHVFVADCGNRRIKLLDSNLEYVCDVTVDNYSTSGAGNSTSGAFHPARLLYEEQTGRLYVGSTNGSIRVFRIVA